MKSRECKIAQKNARKHAQNYRTNHQTHQISHYSLISCAVHRPMWMEYLDECGWNRLCDSRLWSFISPKACHDGWLSANHTNAANQQQISEWGICLRVDFY